MKFSRFIFGTLTAAALACPFALRAEDNPTPPRPTSQHDIHAAEDAYLSGAKHFKDGDFKAAEKDFFKAAQLNPGKQEYVLALSLAQEHQVTALVKKSSAERRLSHDRQADALLAEAKEITPQNPIVTQHESSARTPAIENKRFAAALTLQPANVKRSFHLHAQTRQAVQQVASQYGLRVTFEDDIPSKDIRLALDDVDYDTAINVLCKMADIMVAPLDEHTMLVAKDTQENHDRLDHFEEEVIELPGLNAEQLNSISNLLKQVFDVKSVSTQSGSGTLVVRALPATMVAINRTLDDLMDGGSEVLMRLQIYAISSTHTRDLGVTLPQGFSLTDAGALAQQIVNQNRSLVNQLIAQGTIPANASTVQIAFALIASGLVSNSYLNNLIGYIGKGIVKGANGYNDLPNNGYSTILINANNAPVLNALLQNSDSQSIDDIQLRVNDRQIGTFRIGTRYPVTTSTYSSSFASTNQTINGVSLSNLVSQLTGANQTVIPQIQFEDLGLTLKATPRVLRSGDIGLDLDLKIEALTGQSINNIPVLASRAITSEVTARAGETILLTSVVSDSESMALNGTPGLNELPGFQYLADRNGVKSNTNLLMLLTPTLVRRGHLKLAGPYIPLQIHTAD